MYTVANLPENVKNKIRKNKKGCWVWKAGMDYSRGGSAYGKCTIQGKTWRVHRLVYTLLVGAIPDGFHIDHTCYNTKCCNPEHLEAVSELENLMRRRTKGAATLRAKHKGIEDEQTAGTVTATG